MEQGKYKYIYTYVRGASQVVLVVKNLPASTGGVVQSLVEEDPLDKEMAIHSSILAWEIPWAEEFGCYSAWGLKRVRHKLATK